jgi:hypothetical protein
MRAGVRLLARAVSIDDTHGGMGRGANLDDKSRFPAAGAGVRLLVPAETKLA